MVSIRQATGGMADRSGHASSRPAKVDIKDGDRRPGPGYLSQSGVSVPAFSHDLETEAGLDNLLPPPGASDRATRATSVPRRSLRSCLPSNSHRLPSRAGAKPMAVGATSGGGIIGTHNQWRVFDGQCSVINQGILRATRRGYGYPEATPRLP